MGSKIVEDMDVIITSVQSIRFVQLWTLVFRRKVTIRFHGGFQNNCRGLDVIITSVQIIRFVQLWTLLLRDCPEFSVRTDCDKDKDNIRDTGVIIAGIVISFVDVWTGNCSDNSVL